MLQRGYEHKQWIDMQNKDPEYWDMPELVDEFDEDDDVIFPTYIRQMFVIVYEPIDEQTSDVNLMKQITGDNNIYYRKL